MLDAPPVTPPPTASIQDVLDVLANASPSSMQMAIGLLNDMIGDSPLVDWPSSDLPAVVPVPLDINPSTPVSPSDPQRLLWDELTVEPFVDFATLERFSNEGKDPPCVIAALAGGCGYIRILREVFPSGNADGVDMLLQEGDDAYTAEHKVSLPPLPPSSSAEGKNIRTYVKNTLSRSRAKDVTYIKNHFIFRPEPEPMSTILPKTFGFFRRAWSEERRTHNKSLSSELLARDSQGFYTFLNNPIFQSAVTNFIDERGLDGKVDRHSIQTYVGVILAYLIGLMKTGMEEFVAFSKQGYQGDVDIIRAWGTQ